MYVRACVRTCALATRARPPGAAPRHAAPLIPRIITILKNIPRAKSHKTTKLLYLIYRFGYYKNSVNIFQSTFRPAASDRVA